MDAFREVVELTSRLIRFRTTKDNPHEIKRCMDYIADYFSESDFIIKKFESGGKPSLMISYKKNPQTDLILNGHIDVVEGEPEQFSPREENNKLFGRGAVDMKGGVAAYMVLMKELASLCPPMALMIVSDEETGGENGTRYLLDSERIRCSFVMASEPNPSESEERLDITIKEKGVLWLKVTATGKSAHGSRPWLGVNAIEKLILAYSKIKPLFPQSNEKEHWESTISLNSIKGGDSPNKIPDRAEMVLDIRLVENVDPNWLVEKLKEITGLDIEILEKTSMLQNSSFPSEVILLQNCVQSVTGRESRLIGGHGASDLRFFSEKGIPAVCFGPKGENHHGREEFVYLESLKSFHKAMKEFIEAWNNARATLMQE